MKSSKKRLIDRVGVSAFKFGERYFSCADVAKAERRGAFFGSLAYRLLKSRRERSVSNLQMAFPDWTRQQCEETTLKMFRHFGMITADFMRTPIRTPEDILANTVVENFQYFLEAEQAGKGIIACTGHFGNWERFGNWLHLQGRTLTVVARDANQSGVQDRVAQLRAMAGLEVLSRGDSARPILTKLKKKETIGILCDQNAEDAFVPFFGKPCGTVLGPAVLHQRTGATLLPCYCFRTGPGKYKVVFKPPVDMENSAESPEQLMTELNQVLESVIREAPEQWLWMHDRWKSARRRNLL